MLVVAVAPGEGVVVEAPLAVELEAAFTLLEDATGSAGCGAVGATAVGGSLVAEGKTVGGGAVVADGEGDATDTAGSGFDACVSADVVRSDFAACEPP